MRNLQNFENWNSDDSQHLNESRTKSGEVVAAGHNIAAELSDLLTPKELETLVDFYQGEGKESFLKQLTEVSEEKMSAKEIAVRKIIDKIIKGGAVTSVLGMLPAAMAGMPFVAMGLGVAALAGCALKDAAWWSKKGHHYDMQMKHGVK